ncbi:hypothetical protein O1L60_30535 [Streptomyces diastatochromogenes]|nr:hypothetical protein [Streptomyces diastatochromogenes]
MVWLAGFSLFLGAGIASVNTYLVLFGVQRLGMGPAVAGALIAVLGVAGIAGRIGWSRAAVPGRAEWLPGALAAGAVGAAALLVAAPYAEPLVWAAAVAVGVFAVSGNAVSMVLVMQRSAPGRAGRDSARVAAGFFAGFALGPTLFGRLAESGRYGTGWVLVAAEFAVAGAVALVWATRDRRRGAVGELRWADEALEAVLRRTGETARQVGERFPLYADPADGHWTTTGRGSWAGGFWAGLLWLRARRTGTAADRAAAAACTARLAPGRRRTPPPGV